MLKLDVVECRNLRMLPESLGTLRSLQRLSLRGHEMYWPCRLPDSLGQLCRMQDLDLSGLVCLTALPDSLGSLRCLTRLCLSQCVSQAVGPVPDLSVVPTLCGGAQEHCLDAASDVLYDWRCNVEQHVMFVFKLSKELSVQSQDRTVDFPLAEECRLGRLAEQVDKEVEDARR